MVARPRPAGARRRKPAVDPNEGTVATRRTTPRTASVRTPQAIEQMIEPAMIARYIDALFRLKSGGTFAVNAAEVIRELGDPAVSADELLNDIDRHPATHFEIHLRRLVRGDQ